MQRKGFLGIPLFGCLLATLGAGPPARRRSRAHPAVIRWGRGTGPPRRRLPLTSARPPAVSPPLMRTPARSGWPVSLTSRATSPGGQICRGSGRRRPSTCPSARARRSGPSGHSRAEVQFDDGSLLRLGADAVVTLQTLYSDSQGEFTELRLSQGLASLALPHAKSVFQVDTLTASLKVAGPARFRVGAAPGTEVAVRQGKVNLEDAQGKTFLEAGDYINITDPKAAFNIQDFPTEDGWDQFSDERDGAMAQGTQDKNLSSRRAWWPATWTTTASGRATPVTAMSGCPPNPRPGGPTTTATGSGSNRSAGPGWRRAVGLGTLPLRLLGPPVRRLGLVPRSAHSILVARRRRLRRLRWRYRLGAAASLRDSLPVVLLGRLRRRKLVPVLLHRRLRQLRLRRPRLLRTAPVGQRLLQPRDQHHKRYQCLQRSRRLS